MLLDDFSDSTEDNADGGGQHQGFDLIGFPSCRELLAVAPNAKEGKAGIHDHMGYLVKT